MAKRAARKRVVDPQTKDPVTEGVGTETVFSAEKARIKAQRSRRGDTSQATVGVAISGGGIRSASFGLGVLQALHGRGALRTVDYLSTVSGGGYIGSSLTWFNHGMAGEEWTFPFGRKHCSARGGTTGTPIDYIRQHGDYLKPGDGLSSASLLGTLLRNMLLAFGVYGAMLVFLFFVSGETDFIPFLPETKEPIATGWALYSALASAALALAACIAYSLSTYAASLSASSVYGYVLRISAQRALGYIIAIGVALALLGSLPYVNKWIGAELPAKLTGGSAALLGSLGGLFQYVRERKSKAPSTGLLSGARIWISALLLIYGLLLLTYSIANTLNASGRELGEVALWFLVPSLILGLFVNTNYFGIGRMYRDRLMETFLPDEKAVESGRWEPARQADRAKLSAMCGPDEQGPYQLVNCNVVLVDSQEAKFRGRGGDSFLLSPLYCGSDATQWFDTRTFAKDGMTLATAMSISGAAANPNSGVSGRGPTRNRLVSFLMAFLNLRMGYWARNPAAESWHKWIADITIPNLFHPGIVQGLFGQRLRANAGFLELSDGGHFENTGLYELARRKADVIIISEAGADPGFTMADLANAIERIKVDFGYYIRFDKKHDLQQLLPRSAEERSKSDKRYVKELGLAERGYAVGTIQYDDNKKGTILFIKSTLVRELPEDIYGYKKDNPAFPDQSTVDQFFDEVQLETYRELGYQLCTKMFDDNRTAPFLPPVLTTPPRPQPSQRVAKKKPSTSRAKKKRVSQSRKRVTKAKKRAPQGKKKRSSRRKKKR